MDCSPPGSSVHEIFQARILEWVAMPSSRGSFWPWNWTCVSCLLHWQVTSLPLVLPVKPEVYIVVCCSVSESDSLQPHELWHRVLSCPSLSPRVYLNSCPLSQWCHPTISSSVVPFASCLQSFQHQGLFQWISSSHQVAKVLELQLQHQSFQWIVRVGFLFSFSFRIDCLNAVLYIMPGNK